MPLTRACIPLRATQLETLKGLSRESGAPVAELIRRAIDAYLATRPGGHLPGAEPHGIGQDEPVPAS